MGPERKKMPHGNYQPEAFEIINKKYLSSHFFSCGGCKTLCIFYNRGVDYMFHAHYAQIALFLKDQCAKMSDGRPH